jgi:hypothetical protein
MIYAEAAYFDRHPCAHVAAYHEHKRLQWLARRTMAARRNAIGAYQGRGW